MFAYDIMENFSVLVGFANKFAKSKKKKPARKMFLGKIFMIFCDFFQEN